MVIHRCSMEDGNRRINLVMNYYKGLEVVLCRELTLASMNNITPSLFVI